MLSAIENGTGRPSVALAEKFYSVVDEIAEVRVPSIYMLQWKWGLFICSHVIHSLSCWAMQFPHRLAEQYSQSNSSP